MFVARGATLQAIREHGLRVDDVGDDFVVHPAEATDDLQSIGPVDVVLLVVKGWQVPEAIGTVRPLMGQFTFVVPVMDGIEALDQLATAFGKSHVVGGLAVMLGSAVAPGHIRNTLPQTSISVGELDGRESERVVRLCNAFERGGVRAKIALISSVRDGRSSSWSAPGAPLARSRVPRLV